MRVLGQLNQWQLNQWTTEPVDNWTSDNWTCGRLNQWTTEPVGNWTSDNWTCGRLNQWAIEPVKTAPVDKWQWNQKKKNGNKFIEKHIKIHSLRKIYLCIMNYGSVTIVSANECNVLTTCCTWAVTGSPEWVWTPGSLVTLSSSVCILPLHLCLR